jgi:TRAP-type mannitol/chloroaromatic compound transport system substrate-binding protein
MKKRHISVLSASICLALILAPLFIMASAGPAVAAEKGPKVFNWKLSSMEVPGSFNYYVSQWWAKELEKRTKGRVKIKTYSVNQLCSPKANLEAVKTRVADVVHTAAAYYPAKQPLGSLGFLPFAGPARRCDHAAVAWTMLGAHPLLIQEQAKFNAVIGFFQVNPGNDIMSRKPIRTVEDFKGLKVRAIGGLGDMAKLLGATPIACSGHEIYTGLDRGLFDAVFFCGDVYFAAYEIHDALKNGYYVKGFDLNPPVAIMLINKDAYFELPPDIIRIIEELKWEMPAVSHEYLDSPGVNSFYQAKFKANGIDISYLPEEEREKMIDITGPPIWKQWKERTKEFGGEGFFEDHIKACENAMRSYPDGVYKERPLPEYIKKLLK